jgi:repressor LexA
MRPRKNLIDPIPEERAKSSRFAYLQERDAQVVLKLIRDSVHERGFPPSRREIAEACGMAGAAGGQDVVERLVEQGLIAVAPGIPRGVKITDAGMQVIESVAKAMTEEM